MPSFGPEVIYKLYKACIQRVVDAPGGLISLSSAQRYRLSRPLPDKRFASSQIPVSNAPVFTTPYHPCFDPLSLFSILSQSGGTMPDPAGRRPELLCFMISRCIAAQLCQYLKIIAY